MTREIENVKDLKRLVTFEDGYKAYIEYELYNGGIDLTHTIVPSAIGGRGIAADLTEFALEFAKEQNLKVRPTCSYVKAYIYKHKDTYGYIEDIY